MSLLEVDGLNAYYGDSHILFDVALRVDRNEVVALLGRNGAGKSTTLKSLMGVVTPRSGSIRFDGEEIAGKKSHVIARAGMQLVHEDRRIFGSLNVEENIILAGLSAPARWPLERIYTMFPRLKERRTQPRHGSLRRRAADAGDRARAGPRAEDIAARRAVRRPGADHRARPSRHLPGARGGRADDPDRRTEYLRGHEFSPTASTSSITAISSRLWRRKPCASSRKCCIAISASSFKRRFRRRNCRRRLSPAVKSRDKSHCCAGDPLGHDDQCFRL